MWLWKTVSPCTWLAQRKMSKATCFGRPAPGALPAIGGNGKPGPATSGTSPYKVKKLFLFTASCTTCSVAAGSWKERMTEFFTTEALSHGEVMNGEFEFDLFFVPLCFRVSVVDLA